MVHTNYLSRTCAFLSDELSVAYMCLFVEIRHSQEPPTFSETPSVANTPEEVDIEDTELTAETAEMLKDAVSVVMEDTNEPVDATTIDEKPEDAEYLFGSPELTSSGLYFACCHVVW